MGSEMCIRDRRWIPSARMRSPARNIQAEHSHAWLNNLIHRTLIRAEIPVKEPQGLSRDDGKRPDGLTLVPWQSGRSATWDVTAAHTLATSYVSQSTQQAGSAAAAASARKMTKYSTLSASHVFSSGSRDRSLIRRGLQPCHRNWQKSHALHSRSAVNYVPVPTHFCGNSAFQVKRSVPCQPVHSFQVPIVTFWTYSSTLANVKILRMKYQGAKK